MRSKWFAVFSALVLVSMILTACASPTPTAAPAATQAPAATVAPTKGPAVATDAAQTLRVNAGAFPDNLDPQQMQFVAEIGHAHLAYEGLTRLDKDLKTVPAAAEKWTFNSDATQVTFTLRKDLKYSDGSLLNAKRFEYSLLRNIDPVTAGGYATITSDITGANEWQAADPKTATEADMAKLKAAVDIHALDAAGAECKDYAQADCMTLKIGFSHPTPYFATVASLWVAYPAKEELIKAGGDTWSRSVKYQIGNGPFVWKSMEEKQESVFIPNPNYWGGAPKYNIDYRYITDSATAMAAYKNNEFDVVVLAAEDLKTTQADPVLSKEAMIYPASCTFAVMFHQQKEPFTDQKVRQAFSQAIDRSKYVTDVLKGLGAPTLTWIPKGYPGYDANETRWGFDAAAAKQALADSTYKTADKLPPITLTFSDSPRNRDRFQWLADQWQTVLGVSVKLNPTEATAYTALTKDVKTAPQVFFLGWCADYPDPQDWLSVYWLTGAFGSKIGYSNPTLDALMKKADSSVDTAARADLNMQSQKMLIDTVPIAMMYNNVNTYMVKSYVKGVNVTPQDSLFPGDGDPLSISIQK
jgi:oligopeptide transport system substrate-binding protein